MASGARVSPGQSVSAWAGAQDEKGMEAGKVVIRERALWFGGLARLPPRLAGLDLRTMSLVIVAATLSAVSARSVPSS